MKTLQLKHLTNHFANKGALRCLDDDNRWFDDEIKIISSDGYIETKEGLQLELSDFGETVFMVKHPLSDLIKPIKVEGYNDGKEFVPIVELRRIEPEYPLLIEDGSVFFTDLCNLNMLEISRINKLFQMLYQWHFAVDIPDGTWININTI